MDGTYVSPEPASQPGSFPVSVGWTQATIAVSSVMVLKTPTNLKMNIEMHGPLLIDFGHHAFSWSTPLENFPLDAVHTGLETIPAGEGTPPLFELPGKDLDGLLWQMGINSFDGKPAFWLSPGERYRLTRWPNLTQHSHNLSHVRMIAVLGNAYVSAPELAKYSGVEEIEAQRLINALSLMRILARSADAPAAPVAVETAAAKRQSLFGRLRKRMGR
jgi:hypothetical protein